MSTVSLKNLLVPSKSVEVEYPGFLDFKLSLNFISRETLISIRKKATKTVYKNRQPIEEFDEDIFLKLYVENAIKNWSGLKLAYVDKLAPVDLSGLDLDDELAYSQENALYLMKSSSDFDAFVTEKVGDLTNFSNNS